MNMRSYMLNIGYIEFVYKEYGFCSFNTFNKNKQRNKQRNKQAIQEYIKWENTT